MTELEKQAMELYSFPEARKAYIKGFKDANKWISVSEPPTQDGKYLVFENGDIFLAYYSSIPEDESGFTKENNLKYFHATMENIEYSNWREKGTGHGSTDTLLNPSHWLPLPSTDSINLK